MVDLNIVTNPLLDYTNTFLNNANSQIICPIFSVFRYVEIINKWIWMVSLICRYIKHLIYKCFILGAKSKKQTDEAINIKYAEWWKQVNKLSLFCLNPYKQYIMQW